MGREYAICTECGNTKILSTTCDYCGKKVKDHINIWACTEFYDEFMDNFGSDDLYFCSIDCMLNFFKRYGNE